MKFIKLPLPVSVSFTSCAGEIKTLEGKIRYERGDALMTGIKGEHWPISRAKFEATYFPVGGLRMGESGDYVKKTIPVDAMQVSAEDVVSLDHQRGALHAQPGDWIVTAPDGAQWVVAQKIFSETYQPIESV